MRKNGKNNIFKRFLVILVAVLVLGCFSNVAQAKSPKRVIYKDVSTKTEYHSDIKYMYENGAYVGIAEKGGKFKPDQVMTKREFVKTLRNLYGKRITLETPKNGKLTQKFATDTLLDVSKQLGYRVKWSGGAPKARVTRAKAAYYTHQMIKTGKGHLDPN